MREEMMFCGAGSFKDVDKEQDAGGKPVVAAAKAKAKKAGGGKLGKVKGNPYASRGLDKFSTVVSELESRRERILRSVVGQGVDAEHLMVRFVQSEAKGWVPIIVKLPSEDEQQQDTKKRQGNKPAAKSGSASTTPTEPASPKEAAATKRVAPAVKAAAIAPGKTKKKAGGGGERWSWSWGRMIRPCHYWPLAMVLLLLSLVVFGRVFAICCTSIWWYLLPILGGDEAQGATRLPATKVRISDKVATVAPALPTPSHGKKSSSGGGAHEIMSPRSHAHRKKV